MDPVEAAHLLNFIQRMNRELDHYVAEGSDNVLVMVALMGVQAQISVVLKLLEVQTSE